MTVASLASLSQPALPLAFDGTHHDGFISEVNRAPMLSAEEEHELACRFRDEGDLEAARKLVFSHLRFVVKIARGYAGYGLAQNDLVQEGSIGLMKAVKRFDPGMGVRLVSFAVHWIRAEIHEFILRNWRIVRVATTKAQRKLFFNLRSSKKRLGWLNASEASEVAEELGVKTEEVLQMEARLAALDESFDGIDSEDGALAPSRLLADPGASPEGLVAASESAEAEVSALHRSLAALDARARLVVERRWLSPDEDKQTLQSLASELGVSAERIRQIEKAALAKIRAHLEEEAVFA